MGGYMACSSDAFYNENRLVDACRNADLESFRDVLDYGSGVDFKFRDKTGCTALYIVCETGNMEILRKLCSQNDIDFYFGKGMSTEVMKEKDRVERLEPGNPRLTILDRSDHGECPLFIAMEKGNIEAAKFLMGRKRFGVPFDINFASRVKQEKRRVVVGEGEPKMRYVNTLHTPLYRAVLNRNTDILKVLMQRQNKERLDVNRGSYTVLREDILARKIDKRDYYNGDSPLYVACSKRDAKTAKYLLDAGASPNNGRPDESCIRRIMRNEGDSAEDNELMMMFLNHPNIRLDFDFRPMDKILGKSGLLLFKNELKNPTTTVLTDAFSREGRLTSEVVKLILELGTWKYPQASAEEEEEEELEVNKEHLVAAVERKDAYLLQLVLEGANEHISMGDDEDLLVNTVFFSNKRSKPPTTLLIKASEVLEEKDKAVLEVLFSQARIILDQSLVRDGTKWKFGTALYNACKRNQKWIVKMLIEKARDSGKSKLSEVLNVAYEDQDLCNCEAATTDEGIKEMLRGIQE